MSSFSLAQWLESAILNQPEEVTQKSIQEQIDNIKQEQKRQNWKLRWIIVSVSFLLTGAYKK